MQLTLRALIETYEEMIADAWAQTIQAQNETASLSMRYQETLNDFTEAMKNIHECNTKLRHQEFKAKYGDNYPYRRVT